MSISEISLGLAFLAGVASFLSPCVLSLVPAYISYLGGRSVAALQEDKANRWLTLSHGVAFVLGFSFVFISLGVATSALGGVLYFSRAWLARIGGIVVVIFGIHLTGVYRIPFLEYDLRAQSTPERRRGYLASFLMGIFFSAGWSPCVGPVLGSILTVTLSGGSISQGIILLSAYSAGLAMPFLVASTQIGWVTGVLRRYGKISRYVEIVMGVILILIGVLLFSGRLEPIASWGSFFGDVDELVLGRYLLIALVALALLGLIPAYIASRKGRDFLYWWFFGVGLFPIALPMALWLKPLPKGEVEEV